jgi:hypothetical protein
MLSKTVHLLPPLSLIMLLASPSFSSFPSISGVSKLPLLIRFASAVLITAIVKKGLID